MEQTDRRELACAGRAARRIGGGDDPSRQSARRREVRARCRRSPPGRRLDVEALLRRPCEGHAAHAAKHRMPAGRRCGRPDQAADGRPGIGDLGLPRRPRSARVAWTCSIARRSSSRPGRVELVRPLADALRTARTRASRPWLIASRLRSTMSAVRSRSSRSSSESTDADDDVDAAGAGEPECLGDVLGAASRRRRRPRPANPAAGGRPRGRGPCSRGRRASPRPAQRRRRTPGPRRRGTSSSRRGRSGSSAESVEAGPRGPLPPASTRPLNASWTRSASYRASALVHSANRIRTRGPGRLRSDAAANVAAATSSGEKPAWAPRRSISATTPREPPPPAAGAVDRRPSCLRRGGSRHSPRRPAGGRRPGSCSGSPGGRRRARGPVTAARPAAAVRSRSDRPAASRSGSRSGRPNRARRRARRTARWPAATRPVARRSSGPVRHSSRLT